MGSVIQLNARPRRLLKELADLGFFPDVRDGTVVLVGNPDRLPVGLRTEVDDHFAEIISYVTAATHTQRPLRGAL